MLEWHRLRQNSNLFRNCDKRGRQAPYFWDKQKAHVKESENENVNGRLPFQPERVASSMTVAADTPHVLVVEDHPDLRYVTAQLLESAGCKVTTAENGQLALQHLRTMERLPCLVFLDLFMPVMDGWTLLNELEKDAKLAALPIIVMSAVADSARSSLRVTECLTKPVSYRQLAALVKQYC